MALSSAAGLFIKINLPMREIFTKTAVTDPRFKRNLLKPYFICRFAFVMPGGGASDRAMCPKISLLSLRYQKRKHPKNGCFQLERNSGIKEDFYI